MRVLGGFLKVLGILVLLAATVLCTAVAVMEGIVEGYEEAIWVMAGVWFCALIVALSILGTGMALSRIWKLTKRVEQLESKSVSMPVAPLPSEPVSVDPASSQAQPVQPAAQATTGINKWMPVLAAAGVAVVAVAVVFMLINRQKQPSQLASAPDQQTYATDAPTIEPPMEDMPVETAPSPEEVPAQREMTAVKMGETIATEFVEMTFHEYVIAEDIQKKVTIDNVTRITGPDPISGQPYILISGTIKNTAKEPLPVYDFFTGNINICGYGFDVNANDCDILTADGQLLSEIDPLMEHEIRIYTAIPPELAEMAAAAGEDGVFSFGFYDGFANEELSYHAAFSEDPIAECPYRYELTIQ